jgi:curved DNA-binding protein
MNVQDYYKTLGVAQTATQPEIKKAFRKLAREHHPDAKPGDKGAEARFKEINEANEVLSDPAKREKYDRFGKDWEAYERAGAAAGKAGAGGPGDPFGPGGPFAAYSGFGGAGGPGGANVRYEFRTSGEGGGGDFSDFFRMMFGDDGNGGQARPGGGAGAGRQGRGRGGSGSGSASFEDVLSGMGGGFGGGRAQGGRGGHAAPAAPPPVEATAELGLEEAFHGTSRIVEIGDRRLEVSIPAGVDTGSRVKLTGKGPDGRDLVVVVQVRPNGVFTRRGADLEREIPITLREALLGGEVPVGTLKGRVLLTLPPGTQNGKTFRLSKQGMPRLKGDGPGDLYVRIGVVLPTHLSEEALASADAFLDLANQPDPRA